MASVTSIHACSFAKFRQERMPFSQQYSRVGHNAAYERNNSTCSVHVLTCRASSVLRNGFRQHSLRCQALSNPQPKDKVVGLGGVGLDYLAQVAAFPKPDQKLRTEKMEVSVHNLSHEALAKFTMKPSNCMRFPSFRMHCLLHEAIAKVFMTPSNCSLF